VYRDGFLNLFSKAVEIHFCCEVVQQDVTTGLCPVRSRRAPRNLGDRHKEQAGSGRELWTYGLIFRNVISGSYYVRYDSSCRCFGW
jgi:hypothetical protein